MPATIASPAVRAVRTKSGMTAGQACEPGLTDSTPTKPHNGRENSHIAAGSMMAVAPASRANRHVAIEAPCHSSAMKYASASTTNGSAV